ncbi:MAG: hypothetical protein GIW98_05980 [Candidatus Eremiobacteraeota bacterium]|nr:hypothetical protein [Candidatus Eremiobacteraeota bacterium]
MGGFGVAGARVGAAVGAAVAGAFSDAIGTAVGRLSGTAATFCCGRGTKAGSVGAGLGNGEASGTGFELEGPCGTILANS